MPPNSSVCFTDPSLYPFALMCFSHTVSFVIFMIFTLTSVLFLPLHLLVFWRASRRWRHQCSTNSGATSHSDVFTCNMVAVELINIVGSVLNLGSVHRCSRLSMMVGFYLFIFAYPAQTFFHCLTCVERYLAVVHPVTYRGLRGAAGVTLRNISIGCVWLLSFGVMALASLYFPGFPVAELFALQAVILGIVSFCSLSVLYVMNHLGLKKVGGREEQIDPAKQRAFYTIINITGTLILRSFGIGASNVIFGLDQGDSQDGCPLLMCGVWLCLPSSLVPSLLFLYREGKLPCFGRSLSQGGN